MHATKQDHSSRTFKIIDMKSIALAAACHLVLAATLYIGTASAAPVAAPAAEDWLCLDFEKGLQGWHVVVGDLPEYSKRTSTCGKQARFPETGMHLGRCSGRCSRAISRMSTGGKPGREI